jgi:hypothetical protein
VIAPSKLSFVTFNLMPSIEDTGRCQLWFFVLLLVKLLITNFNGLTWLSKIDRLVVQRVFDGLTDMSGALDKSVARIMGCKIGRILRI